MKKTNNVQKCNIIINTIKFLFNKEKNNLKYNTKLKGIVKSINNNKVNVLVSNEIYENISIRQGLNVQVNDIVWIEKPNNTKLVKDFYIDVVIQ